jgi:citrate lyase subunit beta/citryl-CoA lyase
MPEVAKAREMSSKAVPGLKEATGSLIYSRVHDWRTGMTEADLDKIIVPGLDGIVLAKTEGAADVYLMENRLTQLENERGLKAGSIRMQCLIETARGLVLAHEAAAASRRINSLVFGQVDFTRDMLTNISHNATFVARSWTAIAARSVGLTPIDAPYPGFRDVEGFKKDTANGREMGYLGRMLIHPSQIEPSHEVYSPSKEQIDYAKEVVAMFEDAMKKGLASVPLRGSMIDIAVYRREKDVLGRYEDIQRAESQKKPL